MPGIDYAELRSRIGLEQVLILAGFEASESIGDQLRRADQSLIFGEPSQKHIPLLQMRRSGQPA